MSGPHTPIKVQVSSFGHMRCLLVGGPTLLHYAVLHEVIHLYVKGQLWLVYLCIGHDRRLRTVCTRFRSKARLRRKEGRWARTAVS